MLLIDLCWTLTFPFKVAIVDNNSQQATGIILALCCCFFLQGEALLPEGLSFICTSVALILISVSVLLVSDTPRTAETLT